MTTDRKPNNLAASLAFLFIVSLFVLGLLFPETMWGSHFFAHLNSTWRIIILTLAAFVMLHGFTKADIIVDETDSTRIWNRLKTIIPLMFGVFVNATPMVKDVYGDSFSIIPDFSFAIDSWNAQMTRELLSYNLLNPKIGEQSFYSFISFLAYLTGTLPIEVVKYTEVFCAILFMFFWVSILEMTVSRIRDRIVLGVTVVLSPMTLIFHHHAEMYVLSFTTAMAFLYFLSRYHHLGCRKSDLIMAVITYLLSIKFHILNSLFGLAFIPLFYNLVLSKPAFSKKLNSAKLTLALIGLGTLFSILVYVFITDSVNATRTFYLRNLYDAVFLPLSAKEGPPLDRYNLFSLNHILDYGNMIFLWGPAILFLILARIGHIIRIIQGSIYYQSGLLVFTAFFTVFFLLNPLLAMPTDWDLFSFPAITLLLISTAALPNVHSRYNRLLSHTTFSIAILSSSFLFIHFDKSSLSKRLESVGFHEFKTYWVGSSTTFEHGYSLLTSDSLRLKKYQQLVAELRPFAIDSPAIDAEYAELLRVTGNWAKKVVDKDLALTYHLQSDEYSPGLKKNVLDLVVVYFEMGRYHDAIPLLDRLVSNKYPNKRKAYLIAIHTCMEANNIELAKTYLSRVVAIYKNDAFLQKIKFELDSENPASALELFLNPESAYPD